MKVTVLYPQPLNQEKLGFLLLIAIKFNIIIIVKNKFQLRSMEQNTKKLDKS